MGISVAAENGPDRWEGRLSKRDTPHNIDKWPYGLKICDLKPIGDVRNGVTLCEARNLILNSALPGRAGLRCATGWDGIENLIDLIQSRAT